MQRNKNLKAFNTFGIEAFANHFATFQSKEELQAIYKSVSTEDNILLLGGGSNLLLLEDFEGYVLKNDIKGIEIIEDNDAFAIVKAGAGENWHQFVLWCIEHDLGGIENLSLIPGNVGAAPMQNIGAYGVEIKDTFHSLEAYLTEEDRFETFDADACEFGYRESVFKRKLKNKAVICSVSFKLSKKHRFHTSYGAIQAELDAMGVKELSIRAISDAVVSIRQSKLPNPKEIGNAGSFFKNPVISQSKLKGLQKTYPDIPNYPAEGGVKVAAGWLIEKAGWKGKTINNTYGVHKKQALVLVNYGGAKGKEIYSLSEEILQSVKNAFGIELEREVNIIGL